MAARVIPIRKGVRVGQLQSYDIDAQKAYVRELDAKLNPAVAKCFKVGSPDLAEWAELHGRAQKYLDTWTWFGVYTPMLFMAGQVIAKQLDAWVPRVASAGCPITPPATRAPSPQPGPLKQAGNLLPTSPEQALVLLGILWWVSRKVRL